MEVRTAATGLEAPCAPWGSGVCSSCAHGQSAHALPALPDTIAMVSVFVVRLAAALGDKALGIILARTGRAAQATRRPLCSCFMG